jgi:MFS transporter, DHA1 family, solute carrier family 18 (vesicular amine transporter), member 1/2
VTTAPGRTRPAAAATVVLVAIAVDMFLYGSLVPLVPELPAVAGSPVAAGILFAAYSMALLVVTPVAGHWVDRVGPRAPMLAGLLGLAAATALFGTTVDVAGPAGLALLLAARAAQGIAAALTWTAGLALIAVTHPPERRGAVLGLALSVCGIGVLLGPLITGVLTDRYGPQAPFLLIAALVAADAVARIVLIKPDPMRPNPTPLRALTRAPQAGLLIALTAVGAAAVAFPEPVLPLQLAAFGFGPSGIGLVFAAGALGGALAAVPAGMATGRFGPGRVAAAGTLVAAAGFALCGIPVAAWSVTGVVVVGIGGQLILAPTLVLIGTLAEHRQPPAYGTAYALYNLAYTGGLVVAPLVAGTVAGVAGVPAATTLAAAVALATTVVLALRARSAGRPGSFPTETAPPTL